MSDDCCSQLAKRVVLRHPCDCEGASRPLADGEEPEHLFEIDGQLFPWMITEKGPVVREYHGRYVVAVEIFADDVDTDGPIQAEIEPQ